MPFWKRRGFDNITGPAIKFSDTQASIRTRPPLHGEHTNEILEEIGFGESEVTDLRNDGALK